MRKKIRFGFDCKLDEELAKLIYSVLKEAGFEDVRLEYKRGHWDVTYLAVIGEELRAARLVHEKMFDWFMEKRKNERVFAN